MLRKLGIVILIIFCVLVLSYKILQQNNPSHVDQGVQQNQTVIRWKMANTWERGMPVFEQAALSAAENIKKLSGGRMEIQVDPSNIHKDPFGVFDLVRTGQYEMGHTASYYWKGKDAATPLLTTVPFGMTSSEQYGWFYYGGGDKLTQKIYAKHGLLSFPGGNTGVQMGGWFKKEVRNVSDLKGLKMRIPGLAGDVLAQLGVITENIPAGELYTSLQLGRIDALEWVSPAIDINMGFAQIAKYYYTGWHEPAAELQFLVNKAKFDALPDDLREILVAAMKNSAYEMTISMPHYNSEALQEMKKKYPDVKIVSFPGPVIDAMKQATARVLDKLAENSVESKEIIESQKKYMQMRDPWSEISDQNYMMIR